MVSSPGTERAGCGLRLVLGDYPQHTLAMAGGSWRGPEETKDYEGDSRN